MNGRTGEKEDKVKGEDEKEKRKRRLMLNQRDSV